MSKLKLYNTMTRSLEEFVPINPNLVWIYSCGPTVYSMPHFWNLRWTFVADMIRNIMRNFLWYNIKLVSNFTDVGHLVWDGDDGEDKMLKWAKKEWLTAQELARKYENIFRNYFKKLKIWDFDVQPRATEHIPEQIEMIVELEKKGFTYKIENDWIYMDTSKVLDYGKLLWPNYVKHLEWIKSGFRIQDDGKKNPTDFALWKFYIWDGKRDMERDSPRWIGFPGRHIECSAMSRKYLWDSFDIHHGGYDLIPVHHSNEIAQSECSCCHTPWVKYRIHHQFVNMNGKKMSKSDGNYISPEEVFEKGFDWQDFRYWFLGSHYRSFLDFTRENINKAKSTRKNLIKKIRKIVENEKWKMKNLFLEDRSSSWNKKTQNTNFLELWKKLKNNEAQEFADKILKSVCDDFDTVTVLALLHQNLEKADSNSEICQIIYFLEKNLLKIWLFDYLDENSNSDEIQIPSEVQELANARLEAKNNKDRKLADEIRAKIQNMGFDIKDNKDGYKIEKI